MKIFDIIAFTMGNLFRRKLRALLTISGVVVGTCMIVLMFSLGYGMEASLKQSLSQMGDLTQIQIYNYNNGASGNDLVLDDDAIAQIAAIPNVQAVSPFWRLENINMQLFIGKKDRYRMDAYNIIGVYPGTLENFGFEISEGVGLKDGDVDYAMVFGEEAAYNFVDTKAKGDRQWTWKEPLPDGTFKQPFVVPMDEKKIKLLLPPQDAEKHKPLEYEGKVVGTLKGDYSKGYESVSGVFMDINDLKTLIKEYNKENGIKEKVSGKKKEITYREARVKVTDIDAVESVEQAIKDMGFETNSMEAIRKPMQEQVRSQQMFYGIIGGVTLVVAAIGIINTMIMSIYERTREIGIMKVLGCEVNNIRTAYLMEAGMIGFIGGVAGSIVSYAASWGLNTLNTIKVLGGGSAIGGGVGGGMGGMGMMLGNGLPPDTVPPISIIPLPLIFYAIIFSMIIGLVAGIIPAFRATRISALEAIKH